MGNKLIFAALSGKTERFESLMKEIRCITAGSPPEQEQNRITFTSADIEPYAHPGGQRVVSYGLLDLRLWYGHVRRVVVLRHTPVT